MRCTTSRTCLLLCRATASCSSTHVSLLPVIRCCVLLHPERGQSCTWLRMLVQRPEALTTLATARTHSLSHFHTLPRTTDAKHLPGASPASPGLRISLGGNRGVLAQFADAIAPYRRFGCTMEVCLLVPTFQSVFVMCLRLALLLARQKMSSPA